MENLNLMFEGKIIHSIQREDIGINIDFALISSQLVRSASQHDWIYAVDAENNIATQIYFRKKYMAEAAYSLYGYFLKQQIKKIS